MDTAIPAGVIAARFPCVTPMLNSGAALTGSAATTGVTPPKTFTIPARIPATSLTCGSAASERSIEGLNPLPPPAPAPLLTTKSARSAESMTELLDALTDDAMTVVADTSVTPTIRAAAVAAVRAELRIAFCWPSLPTVPDRASGAPMSRQTGRAMYGPSAEMPMNSAAAPAPTSGIRLLRWLNKPTAKITRPTAVRMTPRAARRTSGRRGSAATSCKAVTGGIRDARRAGAIADSTVISTPTSRPTATVRGLTTSPLAGRSTPSSERPA